MAEIIITFVMFYFRSVSMKIVCSLIFIALSSITFLACPIWCEPGDDVGILTGYDITFSPQKEMYNVNDEIKITINYRNLKNWYCDLSIKLDGGEYLTEDSYSSQSDYLLIHKMDSEENLADKNLKINLDSHSGENYEQVLILTASRSGKYTIGISFKGVKDSEHYDRVCEFYDFSFKD